MENLFSINIEHGLCSNNDISCHVAYGFFFSWLPTIVAVYIAARLSVSTFWNQQSKRNQHVLYALREESKLVNYDCLQWNYNGDALALKRAIIKNNEYRPYSINYLTSKVAIDALMKDIPGIDPDIIKAGYKYHYDDCAATSIIEYISSPVWRELGEQQKIWAVEDAFNSMENLRISSMIFHIALSDHLRIETDWHVKNGISPHGNL